MLDNEHHNDFINTLLVAVSHGDATAFKKLYQLFSANVYNTALGFVQNEHDAEDITQEIFIKIHKGAATFTYQSTVKTWIYRITVNTCLDFLRRKKRFSIFTLLKKSNDPPDFNHPGILLENKENAQLLFKKIDSLPPNQKTAFILSYVEQLPRQEVATIMGTSLKAVESLLQRAKTNLRKKLEKTYPTKGKHQ